MGTRADEDEAVGRSPSQIRAEIRREREALGMHVRKLSDHVFSIRAAEPEGERTMAATKAAKATDKVNKSSSISSKQEHANGAGSGSAKAAKSGTVKSVAGKGKARAPKEASNKGASGSARRGSGGNKVEGAVEKAGAVLDTMVAGAVAGAVTAAAQSIAREGTTAHGKGSGAKKKGNGLATTRVLGEMGQDAAVGAVVGAARAVMPEAEEQEETDHKDEGKRKGRAKSGR